MAVQRKKRASKGKPKIDAEFPSKDEYIKSDRYELVKNAVLAKLRSSTKRQLDSVEDFKNQLEDIVENWQFWSELEDLVAVAEKMQENHNTGFYIRGEC